MLLKLAVSLQNNCYNLAVSFCAFSKQRQEPRPYSFFGIYYSYKRWQNLNISFEIYSQMLFIDRDNPRLLDDL